MKTYGLDLPDNCSLTFHANGIKVRVSINVSPDVVKHTSKNKISKGDKFHVYWCAQDIPLPYCSAKNIKDTYHNLLNTAMQNVRRMKQKVLADEIGKLKTSQTKLNF